jgi:hypothetical protein
MQVGDVVVELGSGEGNVAESFGRAAGQGILKNFERQLPAFGDDFGETFAGERQACLGKVRFPQGARRRIVRQLIHEIWTEKPELRRPAGPCIAKSAKVGTSPEATPAKNRAS